MYHKRVSRCLHWTLQFRGLGSNAALPYLGNSSLIHADSFVPRSLAPARNDSSGNGGHSDSSEDDLRQMLAGNEPDTNARPVANTSRKRDKTWMTVARQRRPNLNPYDLRGAPPQSTHMTGVDARTFQDYISRCGSYSSYLDEAFVLVGFQQPSYFRPDLSKAACIYIGWLLTAGVLDAFRGTQDITYPYYEYQAVRELQKFVDDADAKQLHEVVYPVVILGMFEVGPGMKRGGKGLVMTYERD